MQPCRLLRLRLPVHVSQNLIEKANPRITVRYTSSPTTAVSQDYRKEQSELMGEANGRETQHVCLHKFKSTARRGAEDKSQLPKNPLDPLARHRFEAEVMASGRRRAKWLLSGLLTCLAAMGLINLKIYSDFSTESKMDSGPLSPDDPMNNAGREQKVLVQKRPGEETGEFDRVPTGTTTVPFFPRVVEFADVHGESWKQEVLQEYQLMGCGVRTVSFLRIEVYVVGIYIATDDIATLQQRLIRKIDPIATTLVPGEKNKLRQQLLDGAKSEEIWNDILKDGGLRTLVRIVPTKNTDFHHMRDAWVRHLKARAQKSPDEYGDESFGLSVQQFRQMLSGGSIPKGREMLLGRGKKGELSIWYDDGKEARRVGGIEDERVSRTVLINYLGGDQVASEKARRNVVEGVIEFVERPVGTVATQVHV